MKMKTKKTNSFDNLLKIQLKALEEFCNQIGELMLTMEKMRKQLDKEDLKIYDKTYKNLGFIWDKLQNKIIYLLNEEE